MKTFLSITACLLIAVAAQARVWRVNSTPGVNAPFQTAQQAHDNADVVPGDNGNAGSLHANVKWIDNASQIGFKDGILIIEKNNLYMMMDAHGKEIIPYSKNYIALIHNGGGSKNFYIFEDRGLSSANRFLIDGSGKKLLIMNKDTYYSVPVSVSAESHVRLSFDKEYIFLNITNGGGVIVNGAGEKFKITDAYGFLSEGLIVATASDNANHIRYGFKNLKDQWVVQPLYDEVGPFSEGFAVVGKKDALGDIKYGFIDKTGKEVIPLKYSVRPGSFRYGRALIRTPNNSTSNISHAFIDKNGETVYEVTKEAIKRKQAGVTINAGYIQGLLIDHLGVTDLNGKWTDIKTYIKSIGLPEGSRILPNKGSQLLTTSYRDQPIFPAKPYEYDPDYLIYESFNKATGIKAYGIYWMKTKRIVPAVFEHIGEVDPVSKLFYARFRIKQGTGADAYREGYINEDGIFLFVKKAPADW